MASSSYVDSITEAVATIAQVSPDFGQRTCTQYAQGPSTPHTTGSPNLASPLTIRCMAKTFDLRYQGYQLPSRPQPEKRLSSPRPMREPLGLDRSAAARCSSPVSAGIALGSTEKHVEEEATGHGGRSAHPMDTTRPRLLCPLFDTVGNYPAITLAGTLTPPQTPSPLPMSLGMLSPLKVHEIATITAVQGPGHLADMHRELLQEKHHRQKGRRVPKKTERLRHWENEAVTFLDKGDSFDRPYNDSSAVGEDRIEARGVIGARVRRSNGQPQLTASLGSISAEHMDSLILELSPEVKSGPSRLPLPTPLSPRQDYPHEVRSARALHTQTRDFAEPSAAVKEAKRTRGQERWGKFEHSFEAHLLLKPSSNSGTDVAANGPTLSLLPVGRALNANPNPTIMPTVGTIADIAEGCSLAFESLRQHIPTIDEIVERHAGAAKAATDRAHSLARLATSTTSCSPKLATAPSQTPSLSPRRSSQTLPAVGFIPPRSTYTKAHVHGRPSSDSITSNVAANQEQLDRLAATKYREEVQDAIIPVKPFLSLSAISSPASAQSSFPCPSPLGQLPGQGFGESSPHMSSSSTAEAATHALAVYLNSSRLTRMVAVSGYPSLNVSLADVGSSGGRPVFVFLGLGSVRHLVALFDELATSLGLRLICIDRWGLGRSDDAPAERRGLLEWARVVEYVADELGIPSFGLLAHSAGAPYALATALRLGSRIVGTIHLLSPWVNCDIDGGYKWLKWVPDSVIKTAQAAEWRLQGWALGKPPPVNYSPIGFNAYAPILSESPVVTKTDHLDEIQFTDLLDTRVDDLADFGGSYGPEPALPLREPGQSVLNRRVSGGFLGKLFQKQAKPSSAPSPNHPQAPVSSLPAGKSSAYKRTVRLPTTTNYSDSSFSPATAYLRSVDSRRGRPASKCLPVRSIDRLDYDEFGIVTQSPKTSIQRNASISSRSFVQTDGSSYFRNRHKSTPPLERAESSLRLDDAAFGTALLQASHAESLPGRISDLMAILGRNSRPWGFSYTEIEQPCKIWYGANDDKISEKSMRWCERFMNAELVVVPGEGHNLMTSNRVMVEVLESLAVDSR